MALGANLLRGLALGLLAAGSGGSLCNPVSIFACDTDESCVAEGGEGGLCESNNYCTFPDAGCPEGKRWHDRASSDLAGTCFGDAGGTGSGGDGSGGSGSTDGGGSGSDGVADDDSTSSPMPGSDATSTPADDGEDDAMPGTEEGDTASMDDSTGSMPAMTCDEQYSAAEGYELCAEMPDSCAFVALGNTTASCDDICGMFGGTCLGADGNEEVLCTSTVTLTCDEIGFNDAICTCDRG